MPALYICSVQGAAEGIRVPEERMAQEARYDTLTALKNGHGSIPEHEVMSLTCLSSCPNVLKDIKS